MIGSERPTKATRCRLAQADKLNVLPTTMVIRCRRTITAKSHPGNSAATARRKQKKAGDADYLSSIRYGPPPLTTSTVISLVT